MENKEQRQKERNSAIDNAKEKALSKEEETHKEKEPSTDK